MWSWWSLKHVSQRYIFSLRQKNCASSVSCFSHFLLLGFVILLSFICFFILFGFSCYGSLSFTSFIFFCLLFAMLYRIYSSSWRSTAILMFFILIADLGVSPFVFWTLNLRVLQLTGGGWKSSALILPISSLLMSSWRLSNDCGAILTALFLLKMEPKELLIEFLNSLRADDPLDFVDDCSYFGISAWLWSLSLISNWRGPSLIYVL